MEALDDRSCRWFRFSNHRRRRPISSSLKRYPRFQIICRGRIGFESVKYRRAYRYQAYGYATPHLWRRSIEYVIRWDRQRGGQS
jgi:hypothetical protein